MKPTPAQSAQDRLLLLLIVGASCLRVFVCFQHNPMDCLASDMLRHWNNGISFPRGGYAGAADPIVYQIYISALQHLVGANRLLIAAASAILSVLMPWTYYRAAREFGLAGTAALWVWTLIAWTPSLFTIYHFIMMETLLLVIEGVALWMTARYLRKGGAKAFLTVVFFWTLACLTKPTLFPLAAICLLWVLWKKRPALAEIALAAGLALLMLVPQAVRTKAELGFYAPFGNPWLTRIMLRSGANTMHVAFHVPARGDRHPAQDEKMQFRSPSCLVRPLEPFSSWTIRRAFQNSSVRVAIDAAHGEQDWKQSYQQFSGDADAWLEQWRENIVLFVFSPSWPEFEYPLWDSRLEYWCRWMWPLLIVVVLAGNLREFLHRRFELIPVAVTLVTLSFALQNAVLMEGRYRKPVEPLLLLNLVWLVAAAGLAPVPQSREVRNSP